MWHRNAKCAPQMEQVDTDISLNDKGSQCQCVNTFNFVIWISYDSYDFASTDLTNVSQVLGWSMLL